MTGGYYREGVVASGNRPHTTLPMPPAASARSTIARDRITAARHMSTNSLGESSAADRHF
jgi:hypothetical protein